MKRLSVCCRVLVDEMMRSAVIFVSCLLAVASATFIAPGFQYQNGVGRSGWVNGYGFNAFPGIHNGFQGGYHGLDNEEEYNGFNGMWGYNNRHLYNHGYNAGYHNGYNRGSSYNLPHNNARFGFDQPLGGVNGYYAHPEAVDVFQTPGGEPLFPNHLHFPVEGFQQQQQQQQ